MVRYTGSTQYKQERGEFKTKVVPVGKFHTAVRARPNVPHLNPVARPIIEHRIHIHQDKKVGNELELSSSLII